MSKERARELFLSGYNCAQAMAGGFASELGMSEETMLEMSACFGAGIAGTRELCGVLSGALMVMGLKNKWNKPSDKEIAYKEGAEIINAFAAEFSTSKCKELLAIAKCRYADTPSERTPEYYKARPCLGLVEYCAELLEKMLQK